MYLNYKNKPKKKKFNIFLKNEHRSRIYLAYKNLETYLSILLK